MIKKPFKELSRKGQYLYFRTVKGNRLSALTESRRIRQQNVEVTGRVRDNTGISQENLTVIANSEGRNTEESHASTSQGGTVSSTRNDLSTSSSSLSSDKDDSGDDDNSSSESERAVLTESHGSPQQARSAQARENNEVANECFEEGGVGNGDQHDRGGIENNNIYDNMQNFGHRENIELRNEGENVEINDQGENINGESSDEDNLDGEIDNNDDEGGGNGIDSSDEEMDGGGNDNQPLYTGAQITVAQSMVLLLTLFLKHNITSTCLSDILTLLNLHCPNQGLKKNSLFKFKKFFSLTNEKVKKHFYCSLCVSPLNSENAVCPSCQMRNGVSYFIEMPIRKQLAAMFKRNGFTDLLQYRFQRQRTPETLSDIYDGNLYCSMSGQNGILSNANNISFLWNTDGVPVFKSSKISMWPLFLSINELPYIQRIKRENTILAGLWFSNKKPAMNSFIYAFRAEFRALLQGVRMVLSGGNIINVRGVLLAGTCDLPAKALGLNMMQFNGEYGCPDCLLEGETFVHPSGGNSRVFRYEISPVLRTSADSIEKAALAVRNGRHEKGIKGPSAFSKFMPDFIAGMGIDYMHGVISGVVKKLLHLWFDSCYSTSVFSLSAVSGVIDSRLSKISPPKFVHRKPRTVAELCHWKASELKMWFFYYSVPILDGIMRAEYFQHYMLLVAAVSILNSDCITQDQVSLSKKLLHRFVREYPNLYSLQFCTINVHQLLHLADCAKQLGPLWVYSCFPFENLNGKILSLVHGTSHIDSQIASAHLQLLKLQGKLDQLLDGPIRDFCTGFKHQVKICERIFQSCHSVGTYEKLQILPLVVQEAMRSSNVPIENVRLYKRLLKNGKLFVSETYTRSLGTVSCYVVLNGNYLRLGVVYSFLKVSRCECNRNGCLCPGDHYAVINLVTTEQCFRAQCDDGRQVNLGYLQKCSRTRNFSVVPVNELKTVCVYLYIDNQSYVGIPVNSTELE